MEKISGRYVEDVQRFTVDLIETWLEENQLGDDKQTTEGASAIIDAINWGNMLNREQAMWLKELLQTSVTSKVQETTIHGLRNQFLDLSTLDDLSIYADAWGLYCKPGTYHLRHL